VFFDLLRQRRKRGDIARLPHVGGVQATLSKDRFLSPGVSVPAQIPPITDVKIGKVFQEM
jgi:hypothetical protein